MSASVQPVARSTIPSLLSPVVPIVQIDTVVSASAGIEAKRAGTTTATINTARMLGATVGAAALGSEFVPVPGSTSEIHVATLVAAAALLSRRRWPRGNGSMRREGAIWRTR